MTDDELVAEVLAGRTRAFTRIVERHHARCVRFAVHLLGDRADAEDAVQETFVRAYRGLGRYHRRDAFVSWLFRILVNRCRTTAARRRRRLARFVHDERALESASTPAGQERIAVERRLARALEGLDTAHREAFLLRVGEEMDYAEIARLTGTRVSALKMRVKRARDHVRARWQEVPRA